MDDTLLNIYLASLLVYFLFAAWITWLDKGISVKNAIMFTIVGFLPVLNIGTTVIFVSVIIKDNEKVKKFLNSSIFTRK